MEPRPKLDMSEHDKAFPKIMTPPLTDELYSSCVKSALEEINRISVKDDVLNEPLIIPLGTCSSVPSKYRNGDLA